VVSPLKLGIGPLEAPRSRDKVSSGYKAR